LGEIGQYAPRYAVRSAASSRLFHDPLRSTLRLTGSPYSLRLDPLERPFAAHCRAECVKSQYEFACDFSFVSERFRKATVRVKERGNQVPVRMQWVPIGGTETGFRLGWRAAWTAARGALGASNHGPNRDRVRSAPRVVYGMPLPTSDA